MQIAGDCHSLVPSHGESSDLKCTAVKYEKRSCQVLYSIRVGGSGALFERWGIRLALREISERNVHHVISHKKKGFKVICVLLAPSTPGIKVHLW